MMQTSRNMNGQYAATHVHINSYVKAFLIRYIHIIYAYKRTLRSSMIQQAAVKHPWCQLRYEFYISDQAVCTISVFGTND